jgi:hypothetical protein
MDVQESLPASGKTISHPLVIIVEMISTANGRMFPQSREF